MIILKFKNDQDLFLSAYLESDQVGAVTIPLGFVTYRVAERSVEVQKKFVELMKLVAADALEGVGAEVEEWLPIIDKTDCAGTA